MNKRIIVNEYMLHNVLLKNIEFYIYLFLPKYDDSHIKFN